MVNKLRRVDSSATPPQARAFSGPATVGVEFDDVMGVSVAVPNAAGDGSLYNPIPDHSRGVEWFDDFFGDTLSAEWDSKVGSAPPGAPAVNIQANGVTRLTTTATAGTIAADGVQLQGSLQWKASSKSLLFETRLKIDVITNQYIWAGFTDQIAALQAPATLSVVTFTRNATNLAGFLIDTAATTVTWRGVGKTAAGSVDSGTAIVAATYVTLRVQLDALGNATYFINKRRIGTLTGVVTAGTLLAPAIVVVPRTASAKNLDVDYVWVQQGRF